jgi:hypothetical protein
MSSLPRRRPSRPERSSSRGRRLLVLAGALVAVSVAVAAVLARSSGDDDGGALLVPRDPLPATDVLAYEPSQEDELERAAAFGLGHPLYEKSPGGVLATARRVDAFRSLVEAAVDGTDIDGDLVEAIVFLESGGRPDVIAGDDPAAASGLTQILAETAQNFLSMPVDLDRSRTLTVRIAGAERRGDLARAERLRAERRAVDARFDPAQALAGTVRYLSRAFERLGREDLAVVSYHMGIGNLTNVLRAYTGTGTETSIPELVDEHDLSWARLFFDTAPDRNADAHRLLTSLGDDSPTYYWRVLAAAEIMRLYRDDFGRLQQLDLLHGAKASAEEALHPPSETDRFTDGVDLQRAWDDRLLQPLAGDSERLGFAVDASMGELAAQLGRPHALYRGLREEALALLVYIGTRVRAISGASQPLHVTSSVRDDEYQSLLRSTNPEAAQRYSLHTTGYAFDVRRRYESGAQAQAFQFVLDDLAGRGLIAWVREPAAIHVTVSADAEALVPELLERAG